MGPPLLFTTVDRSRVVENAKEFLKAKKLAKKNPPPMPPVIIPKIDPPQPFIITKIDPVATTTVMKTVELVTNIPEIKSVVPQMLPNLSDSSLQISIGQMGLEFIGSRAQQLILSLIMSQGLNISQKLYSSALNYYNKRDETLPRLTLATNESQEIQNNFKQITPFLNELTTQFCEKIDAREKKIEETDQLLIESLQESLRLDQVASSITVEKVEEALTNLTERLNKVLIKHQSNIEIFVEVVSNLQEAEKELVEAQDLLIKTKEELEGVMFEITALKMLIEVAGLEQDSEMKGLIKKMDLFLMKGKF